MDGAALRILNSEETSMATYKDQMVGILDRYIEEVSSEPTTLDDVFDWAIARGLYHPEPRDIRKIFKESLAESLREEKRFDGKRWYRAKASVRKNIGGIQLSLWADVDKNASLSFMEKSTAQSRRGIVGTAFQLKMTVDHYNEANPLQPPIQLVLDLTDDVAEREALGRFGDDDDEEAA